MHRLELHLQQFHGLGAAVKRAIRIHAPFLLPGGVVLVAAVLCLFRIGRRSLWVDEGFALYDAAHLWESHALEVRPLYYAVLRMWMTFGTSEAWLRALSALFAVGAVFLTYLIGKKLFRAGTGTLGALFLSLSGSLVFHAQEVRMYSMGMFLGLAGALALLHGLKRDSRLSLAGWAMLRVLFFITTPLSATVLPADILIVLLTCGRDWQSLRRFSSWAAVMLMLWAPFALALGRDVPGFAAGWVAGGVPPEPREFLISILLEDTTQSLRIINSWHPQLNYLVTALLAALYVSAIVLPPRRSRTWSAVAWALAPPLVLFFVTHAFVWLWMSRYRVFVLPFTCLIYAEAFRKLALRSRLLSAVALACYLALLIAGLRVHYRPWQAEDWRGAAKLIKTEARSGDRVLVLNNAMFKLTNAKASAALTYYLGDALPLEYLPDWPPIRTGGLARLVKANEEALWELAHRSGRVWIVLRKTALCGDKEAWTFLQTLKPNPFSDERHFPFRGIQVVLVTP